MRKAFTLIELLVVIAIIAILAAILFPVFAQAKTAAKATADLSNIKQIGTSLQIYLADSDDMYMQAYYYNNDNDSSGGYTQWSGVLKPYTKNNDMFKSPLDPTGGLAPTNFINNNQGQGAPSGQVTQYALQDNQAPRLSYIANGMILPRKRRTVDPMNVISSTAIDENARTIVFGHMTSFPRCINDSSVASGVSFKTHRSMNSIKLSSGDRFQGEDPLEIGLAYYNTVTIQEAKDRWQNCQLATDPTPTNLKFHIGYISPNRVKEGANYVYADTHGKYQRPEATLNPDSYQWGLRAYTAGGGEIRNPLTNLPVR